ncbi:hypothetical protein MNB_SM-6-885 [hydrothermal vent metagenome]|uniref:Uncharacterized protein n=1 Tax=hydrothermal vent metagenome TaxID=652676 RepID=A0A1W1BME7_9ZZZZ
MWLKELKIAVVQKDVEQVEKLLEDIPSFDNPEEIEEALYLLKEAKSIIEKLKDDTAESMAQMKKNIDFLNSATADKTAKFDITS